MSGKPQAGSGAAAVRGRRASEKTSTADLFLQASGCNSAKDPSRRPKTGERGWPRRSERGGKHDGLDPCVLSAIASRPFAKTRQNPVGWVKYELATGQQPADFAELAKVEYLQDSTHSWWFLTFSVACLPESHGDAEFYNCLKDAMTSSLRSALTKAGDKEPEVLVEYVGETKPRTGGGESHGLTDIFAGLQVRGSPSDAVSSSIGASNFAATYETLLTEELQKLGSVAVTNAQLHVQHPSEIELCGGLGEPVVVASLPERCQAARNGICEGFELVWYESWDDGKSRWIKEDDFCCRSPSEILARGEILLPARLYFRSPLTRLPNLSERQLAQQLGFGKIKEMHHHRLVAELAHSWAFLQVHTRDDLRKLQASCDEMLELVEDVEIASSKRPGTPAIGPAKTLTLPQGALLRMADLVKPRRSNSPATNPPNTLDSSDAGASKRPGSPVATQAIRRADLSTLTPPVRFRVGRKRAESNRSIKELKLSELHRALTRAGVHWLSLEQEQELLRSITDPSDSMIDVYGDTDEAWEMSLADTFVTDSARMFVHIGRRAVKNYHILGVTKAIQKQMADRQNQDGFDGTLRLTEFITAMQLGGISWLERDQLAILFKNMASADAGGLSLSEWVTRFRWEPMNAAMEVQVALESGAALNAQVPRGRRSSTAQPKFELAFPAFQARLLDLGVGWLSIEQQRVIFDTIDFDRSGTITEDELRQIQQQRECLEIQRAETVAAEVKLRAAAEAEAAAQANAKGQAEEAEKQAEAEKMEAAMKVKAEMQIEKERKHREDILQHSPSQSELKESEASGELGERTLKQDLQPSADHADICARLDTPLDASLNGASVDAIAQVQAELQILPDPPVVDADAAPTSAVPAEEAPGCTSTDLAQTPA